MAESPRVNLLGEIILIINYLIMHELMNEKVNLGTRIYNI